MIQTVRPTEDTEEAAVQFTVRHPEEVTADGAEDFDIACKTKITAASEIISEIAAVFCWSCYVCLIIRQ